MAIKKVLIPFLVCLMALSAPLLTFAATSPKEGGTLKVGCQSIRNLDPHFATSISSILLTSNVYQYLTFIGANNRPSPDLAKSWHSNDGKVWVFDLYKGFKFSNGQPVTAKDVVYSFNRLRNPKVGAPTVKLYADIEKIQAVNPWTVKFTLKNTDPEFPAAAGDYHAAIIPAGTKNPGKTHIGSGAYMISAVYPDDRIILKKNPYFKEKDASGNPLPYASEIDLIFSPDIGGQVEALRGGDLNFVGGVTTNMAKELEKDPHTTVISNTSNMHWTISMRSDKGHVAADNRVREALKLGTDQQAIIDAVRPGAAVAGNGFTPVGPVYGAYYLNKPPVTNVAKAKKLLAEAGYAKGLSINLVVPNELDAIPIGTVWQAQMAKIGVKVHIHVVPTDVYYGNGPNSWLVCNFGVTDWGSRATPVTYFQLAYTSNSPWNAGHWKDPQFDKLTQEVATEMNYAKRVKLYHQLQQILIARGPSIIAYFEKALVGISANLHGVVLPSDWARTRFWNANFAK